MKTLIGTYNLAKWAAEARKAAGMTQEAFAFELGFSTKASVNAIEKGRNKPTFETMVKISEISGVPLPYQENAQTETLKDRLQALMSEYNLSTQQELADFAGVSKGLVGQWFNGQTGLGRKPLIAFERKTNFSPRWLADGSGEKYRNQTVLDRLSDGIVMETLAERINTALQTKGLSVNALARRVGVSYPAMRKITKGETLNPKFLFEIAEALGVSVEWLKTGEGSPEDSDGLADDRIRFERLDVVAALGDGYINNEAVEVVDFVHVDKAWAREKLGGNLSRIQVITARGDSMQGTIEDGDVLFVDTSVHSFEGEGIYLLSFADGLKAKRLQASVGGGLLVISDNPLYRTETIEGDRLEKLTICGKVRGAWHLSGF